MAVDLCSEISNFGASPRISFSRDLKQTEAQRSELSCLDPNFDFDFCIAKGFNQDLRSADELFSNGKILPIQIKNRVPTRKETHHSQSIMLQTAKSRDECVVEETKKKRLKEFLSINFDEEEEEVKPMSKSFWQFRRSTSLNCDNGRSKGLIRSLHFLSRSNSTGSAPNPKPSAMSKDNPKQNSFKQPPATYSQSSSPSFNGYYPYNSSKRPPLKKNCRSYNGNGVRISPVLNIPHNCIARGSGSLFGFGSLFCSGKAKKKKK